MSALQQQREPRRRHRQNAETYRASSPSSSSSWLLRTHFTRAVCYRSNDITCKTKCWPLFSNNSHSKSKSSQISDIKSEDNQQQSHPNPIRKHGIKLHQYKEQQIKQQSTDLHQQQITNQNHVDETDFSFPLTATSSAEDDEEEGCEYKKSQKKDSFNGNIRNVKTRAVADDAEEEDDEDAKTEASPRCSFFHSALFNSFSSSVAPSTSSRWSFSSDSFTGSSNKHKQNRRYNNCNNSRSRSPSPSPRASPEPSHYESPLSSPKRSSSANSSPRFSTIRKSRSSDALIQRVLSWSHLLSGPKGGGERAVLSEDEWMVDLSQLLLGERFASGSHSRLYKGIYKEDTVAVKVIRLPDVSEDQNLTISDRLERSFIREVNMLSSLQHRHVIKFVAACKKPPVLCVITEYLAGGSLRSFLHQRQGVLLPLAQVVRLALNIASGMEYLHMKGIIHRDLKSENLVLAEDGLVKIVDFGVSCWDSECHEKTDDPGTYRWMAPEMLTRKAYNRKVDVYGFGIVLWELLTTRLPYEELNPIVAAFRVHNQNLRPPIPSDCPTELRDLMERCWSVHPNERPEFWEIMRLLGLYEQSLEMGYSTNESPEHALRPLPSWLQR